LARELAESASVLIAANPVFGLDFSAVSDIQARILAAREQGAAVLLISEDLDELLELADTVLVMANGCIVHVTDASSSDRKTLGHYMAGHASQSALENTV
jgi:simple sugar transport system ATP-binding protein